jgi:hypothetical protein
MAINNLIDIISWKIMSESFSRSHPGVQEGAYFFYSSFRVLETLAYQQSNGNQKPPHAAVFEVSGNSG